MKIVFTISTNPKYYESYGETPTADDALYYAKKIASRIEAQDWGEGVKVETDLASADAITSYVAEGDEEEGRQVIEGINQYLEYHWGDWVF